MAKVAVNDYHVLQILFFRQLVVFLSTLPAVCQSFPTNLRTEYPQLHALRLVGAFVALSCGIWAVAVLPLTTAITLGFTQVFFVALLAWGFLSEPVGVHRVMATVAGFMGVVVVMRPGAEGIVDVYTLIPIIGAFGAAVAIISVRKLSQTDSTSTLLVYQAVFIGALSGAPLIWLWVTPDLAGLMFLLAIGVLATLGQWVGVKALRLGEASVVGNIEYAKLIYGVVLGFLVFSEIPDACTLFGSGIIVASSAYIFHRENLSKRQARECPTDKIVSNGR